MFDIFFRYFAFCLREDVDDENDIAGAVEGEKQAREKITFCQ